MKVVSGGQTGVDRAALDAAMEMGIQTGGWCPAGRRAEDGRIPARYNLEETPSSEYSQRTTWNVRDSDATLLLSPQPLHGGTLLTREVAERLMRPLMNIDLFKDNNHLEILSWLDDVKPQVLNVAGPRLSTVPVAYDLAYGDLLRVFGTWRLLRGD